jgi:hypothetical protein
MVEISKSGSGEDLGWVTGPGLACRACCYWGEADVLWEETGESTGGTLRGKGPSNHARIAEITSGRANFQQGLTATCKDLSE